MQKILMISFFLIAGYNGFGQKDSSFQKTKVQTGATIRRQPPFAVRDPLQNMTFVDLVKDSLNKIIKRYAFLPDEPFYWRAIRMEMEIYLHSLWDARKLFGTKAEQSYFVRMDRSTMTAAQIAAHKKIAFVGIADEKPAEFTSFMVGN